MRQVEGRPGHVTPCDAAEDIFSEGSFVFYQPRNGFRVGGRGIQGRLLAGCEGTVWLVPAGNCGGTA